MQLTADAKAILLNYLKDGQREMALQYISRTFKTSQNDSQKLLEAFERQHSNELKDSLPKKFDGAACSGCLSKVLKVISIFLLFVSVVIFALGYFFITLFGEDWNYRQVPVIVKGTIYPYGDSTYVNLIYEYKKESLIILDTGTMSYDTSRYNLGDTATVYAHDIGLGLDEDTLHRMEERQRIFYYVGGSVVLVALVLLAVSAVFKIRPPVTEGGRYAK